MVDAGKEVSNINNDVGKKFSQKESKKSLCRKKNIFLHTQKSFIFSEDEGAYHIDLPKNEKGSMELDQIGLLKDAIVNYEKENSLKIFIKVVEKLEPTFKNELIEVMGLTKYDLNKIYNLAEQRGYITTCPRNENEYQIKENALRLGRVPTGYACFFKINRRKVIIEDKKNINITEYLEKINLPSIIESNVTNRIEWLDFLKGEYKLIEKEAKFKLKENRFKDVDPLELIKLDIEKGILEGRADPTTLIKYFYRKTKKYYSYRKIKLFTEMLREDGFLDDKGHFKPYNPDEDKQIEEELDLVRTAEIEK